MVQGNAGPLKGELVGTSDTKLEALHNIHYQVVEVK